MREPRRAFRMKQKIDVLAGASATLYGLSLQEGQVPVGTVKGASCPAPYPSPALGWGTDRRFVIFFHSDAPVNCTIDAH